MYITSASKLRKAAAGVVNRGLGALGLAKHPDKTFIGCTEKGFDSLGYHFGPEGLMVGRPRSEGSSNVPPGFGAAGGQR
jgi:hypothetical protein